MLITKDLLDKLTEDAKQNARLRVNICLHNSINDKVQRMINALEPGTIVPIHRHRSASESLLLIKGKLLVFFYDDQKQIKEKIVLETGGDVIGVHVPCGVWHSVEVLSSGTIMFEVKEGPYSPLDSQDILA